MLPILQAEQDLAHAKAVERTRRLEALATVDDPDWQVGKSAYHQPNIPDHFGIDESGQLIKIY